MAKYAKKSEEKVEKVMHEYKVGRLKSGGSGKKVKSRKQAIAIGLSEAGKAGTKAPENTWYVYFTDKIITLNITSLRYFDSYISEILELSHCFLSDNYRSDRPRVFRKNIKMTLQNLFYLTAIIYLFVMGSISIYIFYEIYKFSNYVKIQKQKGKEMMVNALQVKYALQASVLKYILKFLRGGETYER
jgi:hypothetical protein